MRHFQASSGVWRGFAIAAALLGTAMIAPAGRGEDADALLARFEAMVRYNLDNASVIPSAVLDSMATTLTSRRVGDRVAAWGRWFHERGGVGYTYGRGPGGYVTEGRLCQDRQTDCVLFMCRVTELARSTSAREAVQFAFGTRFYGASVAEAILEDGRVNYDVPAHLEYSEEMIKSGIWGADVTAECGTALRDTVGSFKVAPDTLQYLPTSGIGYDHLASGDIVWFVGDENEPGAKEARATGTLIHHLGILDRSQGELFLIHPASRPLTGVYESAGLQRLPLALYLARVGRFKGIVVTRLQEF